ncbi:MAG: transposase [Mariprofundales bacterium]
MARPLRIEYEGAVYHVTSRGNARADIYLSDNDREMFLEVFVHVVDRFGWICHAYCLMSNHYHIMIETPQANLSRGMRQLNGIYTQRFNRKHDRVGHVFQGRFKSIVVDKDAYLLELCRYIVRNPVAAGMVETVGDWYWSSYQATVGLVQKPEVLNVIWLLSQFGQNEKQAIASYIDFVANGDVATPWDSLSGADVLGDDKFRNELQQYKGDESEEIPKRKRALRHLPLSVLAMQNKNRELWMREAYCEHGYAMQQIAKYAGLHYSTVSRMIKRGGENARNKT